MDVKKSCKAYLWNKRGLLLGIGAVAALTMVVVTFSYVFGKSDGVQADRPVVEMDTTVVVVRTNELKQPLAATAEPVSRQARSAGGRSQIKSTDAPETDSLVEIVVLHRVPEYEEPLDDYHVDPPPESLPTFNGGDLDLFRTWVQQNVKFPRIALESDVQGRVILSFVVDKDGSLTNIEVLRSPHRSLADEAVRVLNNSPKWTPGTIGGRAVPVKFVLPVDFHMLN